MDRDTAKISECASKSTGQPVDSLTDGGNAELDRLIQSNTQAELGRDYALPVDVRELAPDVLRHRIVLSYEALAEEVTSDRVITAVLDAVRLPDVPLQERRSRPTDVSAWAPGGA